MEGNIYSNLGLKKNKAFQDKRPEENLTLRDFLEHKWTLHNEEELKKTFARELKNILLKEDVFELISAFFDLETDLHEAVSSVEFDVNYSFDEFYKNLSPVLMRSVLENSERRDDAHLILKSIKESIRIAIEEELYRIEVV